jgi:N-acetylmuramate 1-kinase
MSAPPTIVWPSAERQAAYQDWLLRIAARHALQPESLAPASADASFRRYLRITGGPINGAMDPAIGGTGGNAAVTSFIIMDAPPPLEDVRPFVKVAALMAQAGVRGPRVLEADEPRGFLLLTDMGDRLMLDALRQGSPAERDTLMRAASAALLGWQQSVVADTLPHFNAAQIESELALFPQWCVQREFGITWSAAQQAVWQRAVDHLVADALDTPTVAVHSDWMPRNLMVSAAGDNADAGDARGAGVAGAAGTAGHAVQLGILDFQDAVRGPITYDLASMLRDAFITWEEDQELDWAVRYWQQARAVGLPVHPDFGEFWRKVEWMGLQRHLRILGVFCRLKHRDGKPKYSQDLPRFFAYCNKVAARYGPLRPLVPLLAPMSGHALTTGFTF